MLRKPLSNSNIAHISEQYKMEHETGIQRIYGAFW